MFEISLPYFDLKQFHTTRMSHYDKIHSNITA